MKELKAVEILQEYKAVMEYDAKAYGYEANTKDVDEALSELAELTQEESCETCHTSCGLKQAYIKKTAQGVVYCNAYTPKG